jgi:CubicO group peptidase (beta-lactamase class C family)
MTTTTHIERLVAPGFEEVRAEFERNFAERGEIGAAVAAYWRGEKVVDLWGGRRAPKGDAPWNPGHHGRRHVHHQGHIGDDAGGAELGITPDTFARVTALPVVHGDKDVVLGVQSYFSLGFLRPGPTVFFGSSQRAFGAPGAGGSFAFADPDARLGFAYVMNKLDFYLENDPREKALRDAVYRAIAALTDRPGSRDARTSRPSAKRSLSVA